MGNDWERPDAREVEITVLGKGCGESIVVHPGDGAWVVIDSFCENKSRDPAPLVYLKSIGVDPAKDVTAVVLTHMHADHYRGIDKVVQHCESAWFYLPGVRFQEGWEEVFRRAAERPDDEVTGLGRVASAMHAARKDKRLRTVGPYSEIQTRRDGAIRCVGPTSAAMTSLIVADDPSDTFSQKILNGVNFTSTVLWLTIDGVSALFGADLDEYDKDLGWSALIAEHRNKPWIQGASLIKVPHHGSSRAHCPALYKDWCADPIAVIAANWTSDLPDYETVDRLGTACRQIYHTSARNADRRDPLLNDRSSGVHAPTGVVRARRRPDEDQWRVTLQAPAWKEHPSDP